MTGLEDLLHLGVLRRRCRGLAALDDFVIEGAAHVFAPPRRGLQEGANARRARCRPSRLHGAGDGAARRGARGVGHAERPRDAADAAVAGHPGVAFLRDILL